MIKKTEPLTFVEPDAGYGRAQIFRDIQEMRERIYALEQSNELLLQGFTMAMGILNALREKGKV